MAAAALACVHSLDRSHPELVRRQFSGEFTRRPAGEQPANRQARTTTIAATKLTVVVRHTFIDDYVKQAQCHHTPTQHESQ